MNFMNPWGYPPMPAPMQNNTQNNANYIDALYAQYKQSQAQAQGSQPSVNVNPAMGQRGVWVQIREYKEVENYPVPTDGTPMLFFDYEHGVFYSKKFSNGQCCIQDFYFGPTGGGEKSNASIDEVLDPPPESQALDLILEKLDSFEKRLNALDKKQPKSKSANTEGEQ